MPDIHWHIGEDKDQETITHAPSPRRSRRRWIAIVIVVVLGAGLGALYRSIPESAPRPTPLPSPSPQPTPTRPAVPAKLYASIDREAQALADGDVETIIALRGPQDAQSIEWLRRNLKAWGHPTDERALYEIIDFNLRSPTKAWADVRQFRNGRSFRETRFYQWENERWLRADSDPFFWSDQRETLDSPHFHVIYAVEDRDFIQPVVDQLEQARGRLCADLGCEAALTYILRFNSSGSLGWPVSDDGREIRYASPRVTGVYEDAPPLDEEGLNLTFPMTWATVQHIAWGETPAYVDDRANSPLLSSISNWATMRAAELPDAWSAQVKAELQTQLLPLEALWNPPPGINDAIFRLAYAVVHFIEQEYGAPAVAEILKHMASAQSFSDLIEKSLGVPFAEFDQKWQAWVNQKSEDSH